MNVRQDDGEKLNATRQKQIKVFVHTRFCKFLSFFFDLSLTLTEVKFSKSNLIVQNLKKTSYFIIFSTFNVKMYI